MCVFEVEEETFTGEEGHKDCVVQSVSLPHQSNELLVAIIVGGSSTTDADIPALFLHLF